MDIRAGIWNILYKTVFFIFVKCIDLGFMFNMWRLDRSMKMAATKHRQFTSDDNTSPRAEKVLRNYGTMALLVGDFSEV